MHEWFHLQYLHDDHDHDHDHIHENLEENGLWVADNIEFKSVGIDIGSAGTQVIFSRLHLQRKGEDLSSRFVVVSRESICQSPVYLTPYKDEEEIDSQALGEIIKGAYEMAGFTSEDIDTGGVILTGEAIRRKNARAIGDLLAEQGGDFVCASAGHNMEALLAAYGSGAALRSHQNRSRILNIDIGGGTTKLAVVENGRVLETAAIYLGGRLLVVDDDLRIVRFDPGAKYIAEQVGFEWRVGDTVKIDELQKMTDWMSNALIDSIQKRPLPQESEKLFLTPLLTSGDFDGIMFSGGVGEYVYDREQQDFGDLGKLLGRNLRDKLNDQRFSWPLLPAGECIRATVVGASEYNVQVSGNTICISNQEMLPLKNLQVLHPTYALEEEIDSYLLAESILDRFKRFDLIEGEANVALAFQWHGDPSYERIAAFVKGLVLGLENTIRYGKSIVIVLDGDIAQTVGSILIEEQNLNSNLLTIDGILLQDFDFIDVGKKLNPSGTVPVTIKSLVFQL
jgi:ethanolamine utilization protein EutA